jgi:hypothetical protein
MTSSNINLPKLSEDDFFDFSKDTLFLMSKKLFNEFKGIKLV